MKNVLMGVLLLQCISSFFISGHMKNKLFGVAYITLSAVEIRSVFDDNFAYLFIKTYVVGAY